MYEIIVLGATFLAAGIAREREKDCLILESRLRAGDEFCGSLCACYGAERKLYPHLARADVRFGTRVVSVEKTETGFTCLTHGPDGFVAFEGRRVIDTRVSPRMCQSKTFNFLMESKEKPAFPGAPAEPAAMENHYVVRLPIPLDWDYSRARLKALEVVEAFSGEQKLLLTADEFDYQVKPGYPREEGGIFCLPSKGYASPELAFAAGILAGKGVL